MEIVILVLLMILSSISTVQSLNLLKGVHIKKKYDELVLFSLCIPFVNIIVAVTLNIKNK